MMLRNAAFHAEARNSGHACQGCAGGLAQGQAADEDGGSPFTQERIRDNLLVSIDLSGISLSLKIIFML